METTRMSEKELRAAGVIARVLDKTLTIKDAALELGVAGRTIRRMKEKVRKGGSGALAHGQRGKPSHNHVPPRERKKIEGLLATRYADFGPTFAAEKLREVHRIARDPKTVRKIMVELGLWKPRKGRAAVLHRQWRERRAKRGELAQYDGSYHNWLEGRDGATEQCLLAAFDDATGEILYARFAPHEGTLPTMGFWRDYAGTHGLPRSVYVDKFSTYKMNHATAMENPETKTQFKRAMDALHVEVIFANSPQAKGRVERGFGTLQDRLVKELRLRKIATVEEANRFLAEHFIPDFNRRFACAARESGDFHRCLNEDELRKLATVLCKEEERTVLNDFTVPHGKQWYQLLPTPKLVIRPKDVVVIRTGPEGDIHLSLRGRPVNWKYATKTRQPHLKQMRQTPSLVPMK